MSLEIRKIDSKTSRVELGSLLLSSFGELLETKYAASKKVVLVDENTHELCLPYLLQNYPALHHAEIVVLTDGEDNKSMEICFQVWEMLTEYHIQRKDVIINLGGGVLTDTGGFIASVYKRGIDFINIPATLLAMVDASVGGKTGVNLGPYKNQLGVFSLPEITICDPIFLQTLEEKEILSGKAEIIKHGLIGDKKLFERLVSGEDFTGIELLADAVQIKSDIVDRDFKESGERKKLNFGHTVGHALEGFLLTKGVDITHGECVAWGMLIESWISVEFAGLSKEGFSEISQLIREDYKKLEIESTDFEDILQLMTQDKKNKGEKINFTLLEEIGRAKIDFELSESDVLQAMNAVLLDLY